MKLVLVLVFYLFFLNFFGLFSSSPSLSYSVPLLFFLQEICRALDESVELGMEDVPIVRKCNLRINAVRVKIEVKRSLIKGVEENNPIILEKAIRDAKGICRDLDLPNFCSGFFGGFCMLGSSRIQTHRGPCQTTIHPSCYTFGPKQVRYSVNIFIL